MLDGYTKRRSTLSFPYPNDGSHARQSHPHARTHPHLKIFIEITTVHPLVVQGQEHLHFCSNTRRTSVQVTDEASRMCAVSWRVRKGQPDPATSHEPLCRLDLQLNITSKCICHRTQLAVRREVLTLTPSRVSVTSLSHQKRSELLGRCL